MDGFSFCTGVSHLLYRHLASCTNAFLTSMAPLALAYDAAKACRLTLDETYRRHDCNPPSCMSLVPSVSLVSVRTGDVNVLYVSHHGWLCNFHTYKTQKCVIYSAHSSTHLDRHSLNTHVHVTHITHACKKGWRALRAKTLLWVTPFVIMDASRRVKTSLAVQRLSHPLSDACLGPVKHSQCGGVSLLTIVISLLTQVQLFTCHSRVTTWHVIQCFLESSVIYMPCAEIQVTKILLTIPVPSANVIGAICCTKAFQWRQFIESSCVTSITKPYSSWNILNWWDMKLSYVAHREPKWM